MRWRGILSMILPMSRWDAGTMARTCTFGIIWPTQAEVSAAVHANIDSEMFRTQYATVSDGDANWQALKFPSGDTYGWEAASTYIRQAPYFDGMPGRAEARGGYCECTMPGVAGGFGDDGIIFHRLGRSR